MIKNQSGQALVESAFGLILAVTTTAAILVLIMVFENSLTLHHTLYEAALCTQAYPKPLNCESQAQEHLKKSLIYSKVLGVQVQAGRNSVQAVAQIQSPLVKRWSVQESIDLPLQASGSRVL